MNLIIDHGNTAIKFYIFDKEKIVAHKKVDLENALKIVPNFIEEFKPEYGIYSCVGRCDGRLLDYLEQKVNLIFFNYKTPIPIKNLYQSKQTLGTDRLAAVIGANYLYPGQNIVVFDIGTALTVDVITENAEYLGGNISPGPLLRFRALNEFTAKLPLVDLGEPKNFLGQSTSEAILNGVVYSLTFEIDGYVETLKQNFKNLRAILTGGYADFFAKKMKNRIFAQNNLVPIGLNRVLEYNK